LSQVKRQACDIFAQLLGDRPGILVKNKDLIDLGIQVQIYKRLMVNHDSFISNYYKHVTFLVSSF